MPIPYYINATNTTSTPGVCQTPNIVCFAPVGVILLGMAAISGAIHCYEYYQKKYANEPLNMSDNADIEIGDTNRSPLLPNEVNNPDNTSAGEASNTGSIPAVLFELDGNEEEGKLDLDIKILIAQELQRPLAELKLWVRTQLTQHTNTIKAN